MIRGTIITMLTVPAVGTGVLWADSFRTPKVHSSCTGDESWREFSIEDGIVAVLVLEARRFPHFEVFIQGLARGRKIVRERYGQHGRRPSAKMLRGIYHPAYVRMVWNCLFGCRLSFSRLTLLSSPSVSSAARCVVGAGEGKSCVWRVRTT